MSEKFVASNGVELDENGCWVANPGPASSEWADHNARKEFYQHLRDTELGRWRWPDDPRYLVFPLKDDDEVRVLDENSGQSAAIRRSSFRPGLTHTHFVGAALAYFDAHPVSKPWHDAKPGEVWVLEMDGEERAFMLDSTDHFDHYGSYYEKDDPMITEGRRIWPAVVSDGS